MVPPPNVEMGETFSVGRVLDAEGDTAGSI